MARRAQITALSRGDCGNLCIVLLRPSCKWCTVGFLIRYLMGKQRPSRAILADSNVDQASTSFPLKALDSCTADLELVELAVAMLRTSRAYDERLYKCPAPFQSECELIARCCAPVVATHLVRHLADGLFPPYLRLRASNTILWLSSGRRRLVDISLKQPGVTTLLSSDQPCPSSTFQEQACTTKS